jgi:hypothetical protein
MTNIGNYYWIQTNHLESFRMLSLLLDEISWKTMNRKEVFWYPWFIDVGVNETLNLYASFDMISYS